ncbi:MAG: hypothetical protein AAF616_06550 [Bacteroidota bacterium]
MKKLTAYLFILTAFQLSVNAQIKATTEKGKDVILKSDGTWEYVEQANSSGETLSLECADLTKTDTDKMTGKSTTGAKETLIVSEDGGKTGFGIYVFKSQKSIIYSMQAVGAGSCIDDEDKVNILFRDGTRIELSNDAKFNCDAKFTLYFGGIFGKKRELELLTTKEIETMRIWTSKSYVEKDFSNEESKKLMAITACLNN